LPEPKYAFSDIIVLDQPSSGVDYNRWERIPGLIEKLNGNGNVITIILATHDISAIAKRLP
jgi:ABC-type Mn2+/Zn2+ transport system ATPase subunit